MTKVSSINTYPISVPRPEPVWTAHEEIKAWSVILTEVKTDDGLVGYGEIHGSPTARICEWVARFGEVVHGMDALAHQAVWDLKGKAAGLPVWRLLGGESRPLATYATGGYYRPGAANSVYAEEMRRLIDLGYRAVKLKTGAGSVADEAERVGAVRK